MAKVLECSPEESEFKLFVHSRTYTLKEDIKTISPTQLWIKLYLYFFKNDFIIQ